MTPWRLFIRFALVFLPLTSLITFAGLPLLNSLEEHRKQSISTREFGYLSMADIYLRDIFSQAHSDIKILAKLPAFRNYLNSISPDNKQRIQHYLLSFLSEHEEYAQARYIDQSGKETFRVDYHNGEPRVVPEQQLQNKANRYYFHAANQLDEGQLYISPLDLNIENGQLETPYRPVIRFAVPVFDDSGNRRGIVIINYNASTVLQTFKHLMDVNENSHTSLLNPQGYWLSAPDKSKELGFMLEKPEQTFNKYFPQVWQAMSSEDSGQIETHEGLFLFKTLYPLKKTSMPGIDKNENRLPQLNDYYFKVVRHIPTEPLYSTSLSHSTLGITAIISFYLLQALLAWLIAFLTLRKQQQRENTLQRSKCNEEKISQFLEAAPDGFLVTDNKGIIVKVNSQIEVLFGYKREELIGQPVEILIPEQLRKNHEHYRSEYIQQPQHRPMDMGSNFFGQRKNGSRVPVAINLSSQQTDQGIHIIAAIRNITDFKQALSEKEKLIQIINGASDFIGIGNFNNEVLFVNKAALLTVGLPSNSDIQALKITDFHPEWAGRLITEHALPAVLKTGYWSGETALLHKNGHEIPVSQVIRLHRDSKGEPSFFSTIIRDISELKALIKREKLLFKHASDYIHILDQDGNVVECSDSFAHSLGYTKEQALKLNVRDWDDKISSENISSIIRQLIDKPEIFRSRHRRKDGSVFDVEINTNVIELDHELYLFASSRNITQIIETENYLKQARQHAEQSNKAKSAFLANMSHEIRTPLAAITGSLELLSQTQLDSPQQQSLELAQNTSRMLLALLNDILDFSKIEAGKLELENKPFSLQDNITHLLSPFSLLARQKGLQFNTHTEGHIPEVLIGDPNKLNQILINLLNNAIKFTRQGEVSLNIGINCGTEELKPGQCQVNFEVVDSGIGIPMERQASIFDAFEQAETSTTRKYGGTGLGLSISSHLAEAMNSQLKLESSPETGSRFYFTLILEEPDLPENDETETIIEANNKNNLLLTDIRILVTDDNPALQHICKTLLESQGAIVGVANNGLEAVKRIANDQPYDMVLMDIQMPEMDGHTATRKIRESHDKNSLPIVAMTASAMKDDHEAALLNGMNGYLVKPVELSHLLNEIQRLGLVKNNTSQPSATTPIPVKPVEPVIDDSFYNLEKALRLLNSRSDLYLGLANYFFESLPDMTANLHKDVQQDNAEATAKNLHAIKGMVSQLGAEQFTAWLQQQIANLRSGTNLDQLPAIEKQALEKIEQAKLELKKIVKTINQS